MRTVNLLQRLSKQPASEPIDLKPGYNATGFGVIHLKLRVYRAAEGKWYDVEDEVKS